MFNENNYSDDDYVILDNEEETVGFDEVVQSVGGIFSKSDYERESKHNKVVNPKRGSHGGIKTSKQVRLPTQSKSKKVFCRNCNKQNTESAKVCIQCEVTLRKPPLRRKMK